MNKLFYFGISCISILSSCTYESIEPAKVEVTDTVISYAKTIVPLIDAQCGTKGTGCHESGAVDGDFTVYDGVKEKADDGSLYKRVVSLKDMPKAGSGFTLTDQERNYFAAWINQGFSNN